jgi:acyl phosphate:glycerol-3-phosphate acyltransferase
MSAYLLLPLAYLLGSIPTAYAVGRVFHGLDLRKEGSGNLGATNAFRVLGWKSAVPVFVVDIAKGWIPARVFPGLLAGGDPGLDPTVWAILFGALAIAGHVFSVWVGFRGGKGVATSAGVFLALAPWPLLACFGVWILAMLISRTVSLASILAAAFLPLAMVLLPHASGSYGLGFTVFLSAFVIWAHRDNIRRLRSGTERRMSFSRRGSHRDRGDS